MPNARRILPWLVPALLVGGGPALAGERDAFLSQLADSTLLSPRFSHLEPRTTPAAPEVQGLGEAGHFNLPSLQTGQRFDAHRALTLNALAIEWQHSLNSAHRFGLSAQYGDYTRAATEVTTASGSAAAVSWSTLFGADSRVTGRLFYGDEDARDRNNGFGARRYYGLLLEGRYSPWRDHTPFASLVWQRSDYDGLDMNGAGPGAGSRYENLSRIAAGWSWQPLPSLDVRAEANYRLTDETTDPAGGDRAQLYFSTQFGFR